MIIKRSCLLMSILAISAGASAAPSGYIPGSALTTGGISNSYALSSLAYNPASAQLLLRHGEKTRFGWLSSLGVSTEFGNVANFEDEINQLSDELDRDDLTLNEAGDIVDRFNGILPTLGAEGYMKLSSGGAFPLMPVVFTFNALPGNLFVDASTEVLISGRFLDAPVSVQISGSNGSVSTQSSLYLKSGTDVRVGFGYAQPIFAGGTDWKAGQFILGGKVDVHRVGLSKQVLLIDDVDDFGDTIKNDYDQNEAVTTAASLSVGAIWKAENYQLGLTLNNVNEPEFDYGVVGTNCGGLTGTAQNNCFQAQNFAADGRIDSTETHTMRAYSTVDASFWATPNLMLGTSLDLGEHEDFLGASQQWLTIATFYQPGHWAIPGIRAGFRQNQVGSELSSATFGFTLFKNVNFDLEYGLDTTTVDGSSMPRSLAFNFGFEEHF